MSLPAPTSSRWTPWHDPERCTPGSAAPREALLTNPTAPARLREAPHDLNATELRLRLPGQSRPPGANPPFAEFQRRIVPCVGGWGHILKAYRWPPQRRSRALAQRNPAKAKG